MIQNLARFIFSLEVYHHRLIRSSSYLRRSLILLTMIPVNVLRTRQSIVNSRKYSSTESLIGANDFFRTNVPDIAMSFTDLPFPYGPFVPHHIPRQYIENYFAFHRCDSSGCLILNTTVEDVTSLPCDRWRLILRRYGKTVQHLSRHSLTLFRTNFADAVNKQDQW
jgi:hypothetical protein